MPPKPSSAERARRLLALLPLLGASDAHSLRDLATSTGSDAPTVAEDLALLSLCGSDQGDPTALVPVLVEGGSVFTFGEIPALDAPVRLTVAEAGALVAALEACGVDPEDAVTARLASVSSAALDVSRIARTVRAASAPGGVAHSHAALTAAAAGRRVVRMTYAAAGEAETRERSVRPWDLFMWRGSWYLRAWDEERSGVRTFRLDRIDRIEVTERVFERPSDIPPPAGGAPDASKLPRAEILFSAAGPDLTDRDWPGATFAPLPDGRVRASVPYAGTAWIARRVAARLGGAVVVSPPEVRAAVAELARKELADL